MSDSNQPPPYPGAGRPLGPGHDPSSAPTQVGPPGVPPGVAPPPPPVAARPLAPPPYGQAPWGPPPPPPGRGSRVGLVLGLLALVLVLVGGGVTAFLVLRGADDDGTTSSDSERGRDPDVPPSDEPAVLDPDAVEADLSSLAAEVFPGTSQAYLTAHSWSTAADNLDDDRPRDLGGAERDGATSWTVGHGTGEHTYSIYVEHLAPDYAAGREQPGCDPEQFAGAFCEVHTTPSGTTAYEQVYTYGTGGSRYLWVPGDPGAGRPDLSIAESLSGQPDGTTAEALRALFDLDAATVLAALDDDRLRIPAPPELPPLPSFQACSYLESPPGTCPPGLR